MGCVATRRTRLWKVCGSYAPPFQRTQLKLDVPKVASINAESVRALWASLELELYYFVNDDDERYSIQVRPCGISLSVTVLGVLFAGAPGTASQHLRPGC